MEVSPYPRTPSREDLISVLERAEQVSGRGDERWIGGIQFRPVACGGGGIHVDNCAFESDSPDSPGLSVGDCVNKVFNGFHDSVKYRAINVFSSVSCGTFSDREDVAVQANQQFDLSKGAIVAFELMYGQANKLETTAETCDDGSPMPQNPFIADTNQFFPTATVPSDWTTATVLDPVAGLALINNLINELVAGAESTIHIPASVATIWDGYELITRDSANNWRTNVGNHLVIASPGYHGSSPYEPDGHSPAVTHDGVGWAYVTGPVGIYIGDRHGISASSTAFDGVTFDHRRNNYFTVVEQFYLPYFDPTCPRFAVPIGRDCTSVEIDLSTGGVPVDQIYNDHYITCVDFGAGTEGTPMDPDIFVGADYVIESS